LVARAKQSDARSPESLAASLAVVAVKPDHEGAITEKCRSFRFIAKVACRNAGWLAESLAGACEWVTDTVLRCW